MTERLSSQIPTSLTAPPRFSQQQPSNSGPARSRDSVWDWIAQLHELYPPINEDTLADSRSILLEERQFLDNTELAPGICVESLPPPSAPLGGHEWFSPRRDSLQLRQNYSYLIAVGENPILLSFG